MVWVGRGGLSEVRGERLQLEWLAELELDVGGAILAGTVRTTLPRAIPSSRGSSTITFPA